MRTIQRFLPSCLAFAGVVAVLSGCVTEVAAPPPKVAEPLTRADHFISVRGLHCNRDHTVAAIGSEGGRGAVALHSEDQGLTWRTVDLGPNAAGYFVGLVALPAKGQQAEDLLYAAGYEVVAPSKSRRPLWWKSTDGGRSWAPSSPPYPLGGDRVNPIVVADEQGTLLTIQDTLLRSTDGGSTWESVPARKIQSFTSVVTNGRGHAVIAGMPAEYGQPAMIFWSDDSGATWTPALTGSYSKPIWLYGNPDHALIAYGPDSIEYRSEDGGRTWQRGPWRLWMESEDHVIAMSGDGKGRVVALLASGAARVSHDWGKTWVQRDTGIRLTPLLPFVAIDRKPFSSLISAGNGILIGNPANSVGRFTRSADWGETWHTVDSQIPGPGSDGSYFSPGISCTDGRGLIVVGGDGGMITRTRGFFGSSEVRYFGGWGALTRSTDWGATWQRARMADKP